MSVAMEQKALAAAHGISGVRFQCRMCPHLFPDPETRKVSAVHTVDFSGWKRDVLTHALFVHGQVSAGHCSVNDFVTAIYF